MKKLLFCAMALFLATTLVDCTKQQLEEREEVQEGSTILRGKTAPEAKDGKEGDYYVNETTVELYGPKTAQGWGDPVKFGKNDKGNSKILSGTGAPSNTLGNEGDWYIDKDGRRLYGPKTQNQWGNGIVMGSNPNDGTNQDPDATLPNYRLGDDGKTLLAWTNPKTQVIDMTKDPKLNQVDKLEIGSITEQRALQKFVLGNQVNIIEASAFKNCFYLEEFIFNNSLTSIGSYAFQNCLYLETMNLPNSLESLGQQAFLDCVKLKKVTIPAKCKNIYGAAFEGCEALDTVILNEGVENIYTNAFQGCKSLKSITFPKSLKGLGAGIFKEAGVTEITFLGAVPDGSLGQGSGSLLEGNTTIQSIYVPEEHLEDYKSKLPDFVAIIHPLKDKKN